VFKKKHNSHEELDTDPRDIQDKRFTARPDFYFTAYEFHL
jgi:hypothetical protein